MNPRQEVTAITRFINGERLPRKKKKALSKRYKDEMKRLKKHIKEAPEPQWGCKEEWDEDICPHCSHIRTEQVSHPGGGYSTVDKNRCDLGFFVNDF